MIAPQAPAVIPSAIFPKYGIGCSLLEMASMWFPHYSQNYYLKTSSPNLPPLLKRREPPQCFGRLEFVINHFPLSRIMFRSSRFREKLEPKTHAVRPVKCLILLQNTASKLKAMNGKQDDNYSQN